MKGLDEVGQRILLSLPTYQTNKQLSQFLKLPKYTISRRLNAYKKKRLVTEKNAFNYKIWELTQKGKDAVALFLGGDEARASNFPLQTRSHKFVLKSRIVRDTSQWADKAKSTNWISYVPNNWTAFRKNLFEVMVVRTPNFFFFYFPDRTDFMVESNFDFFIGKANQVKKYLEDSYEGLVLGSPEVTYEIMSQHHALQFDPLAIEYKKTSVKEGHAITYESDRINIDSSKGVPETETVNKAYAVEDLQKLTQAYEDIIRKDIRLSEVANAVKGLAESQAVLFKVQATSVEIEKSISHNQELITANQQIFDQNMASHIKAVQALAVGVENLTKEVINFRKARRPRKVQREKFKGRPDYVG